MCIRDSWNKLENEDLIHPCQSLYVLPPNSVADNTAEADLTDKGAAIIYKNTAPENIPTPAAATVAKKATKPVDSCDKLGYEGVHIVQKGETLYSIAKANDLTVDQIQKWNKLGKKDKIKPCTSLYIKTPETCLLYTSPSPRDATLSRMPSSA